MKNEILIRRANKLVLPTQRGTLAPAVIATFNQNIQSLGYTLAPSVIKALKQRDHDAVVQFFLETLQILQDLRGVHGYRPMYPNFPTQVMDASAAELYLNAIFHYFSVYVADVTGADVIWLPKYRKDKRDPLAEEVKLTILEVATELDLDRLATRIATSNTSLSDTDTKDLKWLIDNDNFTVPSVIPNKENLAIIAAEMLDKPEPALMKMFKTTTDVLRLATIMSEGDASLAENTKFRNFTRPERKTLLGLLESISNREEDMLRHYERWIRLGERLHPGDYMNRYPSTYDTFTTLRSNFKIPTFNSRVEKSIRSGEVTDALELLGERGGDFARRLDHLLRSNPSKATKVANQFKKVAANVSTPVLLQVMSHFKHRNASDFRVAFPKGSVAKVRTIGVQPGLVTNAICSKVQVTCTEALLERFGELPKLGKVYVDPDLKDYLVPFSQRSASKALRTLVRGSMVKFGSEKNTIRFFIWWKDCDKGYDGRVDLDLSAVMYDAKWDYKEHIAYYNLRSAEYQACHSGDITSAPNGACEFIDVDIPSVIAHGGRYVIMMVNSFTHQNFADIPECSAGWMLREKPKSGEVFDARTVQDKVDLTMQAQAGMPTILDLVDRKVIWADAAVTVKHRYYNNVHSNRDTIKTLGEAFTKIHKPNLYDLFMLHAVARGKVVTTPDAADTLFTVAGGVQYQLETIASEYMSNAVKKEKAMTV